MTRGTGRAEAALREPTVPVGMGWTLKLSAAVLGFSMAVITPIQILLPLQIADIAPERKEASLAVVTACAAVVAILAAPIAGALSDRTTSRLGRRRPWILGGAVVCGLALAALPAQATVLGVALLWMAAQGAQNAMFAGLTATVPDQVPVRQRGFVSAFVGLPLPLGVVLGVLLVTTVVPTRIGGYLLLAGLVVLLALPFVLTTRDPRLPPGARPPFALRRFVRSFWISPRQHPDFAWAAVARLAIQLANSIATLYLLYFLRDVLRLPDPARGVFVLTLVYTAGILATSVLAGRLSDRSGRRKVFVVVSSVVIAVSMLMLSVWHTWSAVVVAAGVLGLGYGVYVAIDNALITQVLPAAGDRAKDLGIVNLANTAPQAFAPAIAGGIIATLGSYTVLYLTAGAIALVGAALVLPIRSVR
ncbi:Na+/melibiose symporter [Amycolatopsis arida]|uniref:Na+/melibiose symporter n=1 Tax=Amycolatopsis arida TaxID=587909 RepID=A0A1I5KV31_9PSEU|nr:MFS transporter [Amycolatopsis arida]TDX85851.1 Na+/melibiose symporter-like transporter [Amycolatopsis arida]SFO88884.1 Na+/melibiose symporter [Amycolatopsis arida]